MSGIIAAEWTDPSDSVKHRIRVRVARSGAAWDDVSWGDFRMHSHTGESAGTEAHTT